MAYAMVEIVYRTGVEVMKVKRGYLISVMALFLLIVSPAYTAEQDTLQAIIPWEADGRVFQVDTKTMMFVGAVRGVMYIASSHGDMHEAFVMCPIVQKLYLETGQTEAVAHCEISASPDDVAYAKLSCSGEVGSCQGTFELIDGEGRFAGISGTGTLRIRSPMRVLIADMAAGAVLRVASGIMVVKDLNYHIP